MPRKFCCYMPKNASRKRQKVIPMFSYDENVSHDNTNRQIDKPVSCSDVGLLTDEICLHCIDAEVQTDEICLHCIDAEVQTDEICLHCIDVEVQTDVSWASNVDIAVQTDEQASLPCVKNTVEEQVNGNSTVDEVDSAGDLTPSDIPLQICEGNNDDKFSPLIKKHKGVFTNSKGISCSILLNVCCVIHTRF